MSTVDDLRVSLQQLGCGTSGNKDTLKQRLRKARKSCADAPGAEGDLDLPRKQPDAEKQWAPLIHTFLVTDIEATCEQGLPETNPGQKYGYPNEIIELPIVMLCWNDQKRDYEKVGQFHRFVRPLWRPRLSRFCIDLTGIEQAVIDEAQTWPVVLRELYNWLWSQGLLKQRHEGDKPDQYHLVHGVCWVTHGPDDLHSFVPKQSWIAGRAMQGSWPDAGKRSSRGLMPLWLRGPVLDVRKAYCLLTRLVGTELRAWTELRHHAPRTYGRKSRRDLTLDGILAQLGMSFEGRQHSGLCDTHNVARILIDMARRVRDSKPVHGAKSRANLTSRGLDDAMEKLASNLAKTQLTASSTSVSTSSSLPAFHMPPTEAAVVLIPNQSHPSDTSYDWMTQVGCVDWPYPPEP